MKEHPSQQTARILTLLAKIIQNAGNLVNFGGKEEYMKPFNDLINENFASVQSYIDGISVKKIPGKRLIFSQTIPTQAPVKVVEVIDQEKEIASVFHHLVKSKEKLMGLKEYAMDVAKLPTVLSEIQEKEKKYNKQ